MSAATAAKSLLLLVALASCGGGRGDPATAQAASRPLVAATVPGPTTSAQPETSAGPRHATLHFDLGGRKFPLPVVHGTIAGQSVWMLVDTGANSHVLASWVVRRAGLAMRPLGDVGSDHTGRAVSAYTVEHPGVAIDEWGALRDGPMLVTDVPEPIERIGIGAFVSPQWLAGAGEAIVLDLPDHEMHTSTWDDAAAALDARSGLEIAPRGVRFCRDDSSAIRGLAFVLRASVDGLGVDLLLDTGAHRTDLLSTSQAARRLNVRATPSREQMYAASGLVKTSVVQAADVHVGDWALTSDIDLVPGVADPLCPRDGVVSMDALQSCTLLLAHDRLRGRCGP